MEDRNGWELKGEKRGPRRREEKKLTVFNEDRL
jgi:hypothetical protein